MQDWYKLTNDIISKHCGGGLIFNYYQGSSQKFLEAVYPEYNWLPWKFNQTSKYYWKDIQNQ
jgi:hypothetical protein